MTEVRFGAGWAVWPELMPRFREAELRTQAEYPGFCAEAIISGISPARPNAGEVVDACLEARKAGLAGIDFIPIPYDREADPADWAQTYSWAEQVADAGLGITVHAGEFSPANVSKALRIPGVSRVGHAVYAASDNGLFDQLSDSSVTVECCLTSNVVVGAVPSLASHPIRDLVDAGVPVTISSDDPISLCTTIQTEYELAARLGFSRSELLEFTRNGIVSSFISDERKTALLARLDQDTIQIEPLTTRSS